MLEKLTKERILVLDGAMGTMIQTYGLTENDYRGQRFADYCVQLRGNNDLLTLTRPDIVENVHRKYLEAGADIIETNTFSSQRVSMGDYGLEALVKELNVEAARLARHLADEYTSRNPEKPRFVAGSIGPTSKSLSMSPDVENPAFRSLTFDELHEAYVEQIEALMEGGVDALLIETVFDTLNAKAALLAARKVMDRRKKLPLMLSVTLADKGGRILSGQTLDALLASVEHFDLFSIGLNCSFGAAEMKPFLRELAAKAPCRISVYPNAGLPNSMGGYDQTPQMMAREMADFVNEGLVNIIGGCCGTTDAFIAEFPRLLQRQNGEWMAPRRLPTVKADDSLKLSGLDLLELRSDSNFLNIGERCNVAGSRKFLRLIREKNYDEAVQIARKQVEDGAQILDINMDDGLLNTRDEMVNFLNLLAAEPEIARVPFMIDSSQWDVIEAALKCVQGKCVVNSISLKEGEAVFLEHARLARSYGAAVVVMAFDEAGQADTYERKIEICERAYRLLVEKAGYPPQDIIFDPNILAISTGMPEHDAYALDFINATRWICKNLKGSHVSGGVSNLSFAFRGNNYLREAMHVVFLYHAIQAGMDMGIVNPGTSVMYEDIPADLLELIEDVVLNRRKASEELILAAGQMTDARVMKETIDTVSVTPKERLHEALVKGRDDKLEAILTELLKEYPTAVEIIEGPMMEAMNHVGDLFGKGQMFLPQVVKTARIMKKAVAFLQPQIETERSAVEAVKRGKFLVATVKGDVHDIGKNIVSVVMACNNYEMIDLGVMCPPQQILTAAINEEVDLVGLSALITPSLDEMVNTARAMQESELRIPLLIGGATTSKMHTALKIAPVYDGPVVWVKDASQMVAVAAMLMSTQTEIRESYIAEIRREYDALRQNYAASQAQPVAMAEARKNKLNLFD